MSTAQKTAEKEQFDLVLDPKKTTVTPRTGEADVDGQKAWRYVGIAGQMGFDIALPIVIGLIAGVELDKRWGTAPKAVLTLLGVGLFVSAMVLYQSIKDMMRNK